MKEKIKSVLADIVYWMYQNNIWKNHIQVMNVDETIDALLESGKSLARYGDGEIVLIDGRKIPLQDADPELAKRLGEILRYDQENLLVSISNIFDGVSLYTDRSQHFWKNHLLIFRRVYEEYCSTERRYCDTFVSRPYYNFADKGRSGEWFAGFRKVWEGREIVVVEGAGTHNGVGNDLLDNVAGIERILCPPSNAWRVYAEIFQACLEFTKDRLFLISLGAPAKVLVSDLTKLGYRAIDIGNLDMEYEWFLRGTEQKTAIPKHSVIGRRANEEAGYLDYLSQIRREITL